MGKSTFYVQNGAFKRKYDAINYEVASQMAILDIVEKDNWSFAPFMAVSNNGYIHEIDSIDNIEEAKENIKIMLTYNVIRSVAKYVDVNGEERKAWLELARSVEEATMAYDGGDKYHDLVHELVSS